MSQITTTTEQKIITTRNASECNAYELRQELNRRNAFDFKENDTINYRTMLQRLMIELIKDEENLAAEKARLSQERIETEIEKSKRIREEKKREALERSKQRQTNPNYFTQRVEANSTSKADPINSNSNSTVVVEDLSSNENESEVEVINQNPFESFPKKTRSKIYVK